MAVAVVIFSAVNKKKYAETKLFVNRDHAAMGATHCLKKRDHRNFSEMIPCEPPVEGQF